MSHLSHSSGPCYYADLFLWAYKVMLNSYCSILLQQAFLIPTFPSLCGFFPFSFSFSSLCCMKSFVSITVFVIGWSISSSRTLFSFSVVDHQKFSLHYNLNIYATRISLLSYNWYFETVIHFNSMQ